VFIDQTQFIAVSKMPVPFRHASVLKANVATSSPPRRDSGRATFIYSRVVISYRDIGTSPRRDAAVEGGFRSAASAGKSRVRNEWIIIQSFT